MTTMDTLEKPFELGFTYTRSTGPVIGRFLGALAEHRILGVRGSDGRVLVPPPEFDPVTAAPLDDWVELGTEGVILSWCWVAQPRASHPLQEAFAWIMVQLDGADVPMIHCLRAPAMSALRSGARVRACWVAEPVGRITDLCCFELVEGDKA